MLRYYKVIRIFIMNFIHLLDNCVVTFGVHETIQ